MCQSRLGLRPHTPATIYGVNLLLEFIFRLRVEINTAILTRYIPAVSRPAASLTRSIMGLRRYLDEGFLPAGSGGRKTFLSSGGRQDGQSRSERSSKVDLRQKQIII